MRRHGLDVPADPAGPVHRLLMDYHAEVGGRLRPGLTWRRRRFQRLHNALVNLPDTVVGQAVVLLAAYPRSYRYR